MNTQRRTAPTIILGALLAAHVLAAGEKESSAAIRRMVDSVSVANLRSYVLALERAGGAYSRVDYPPGYDSAAAFLKQTFDSFRFLSFSHYDTFLIAPATAPF